MNQDIDLLAVVAAENRPFPTGLHAAGVVLATLAASMILSQWLAGRAETNEREIVGVNSSIDDLVFNLEERSKFLVDRNADPLILEQIEERERELADKRLVLDLLSGETLGNTQGFASRLAALGRRHPDGLWLQRILVADGGRRLELHGQAQQANLIPEFLDALKLETAFSNTGFETVAVTAHASGTLVDFILATGCGGADEASADDVCAPSEPTEPAE